MQRKKYTSVEEYLADFGGITRERLEIIRMAIQATVPEAKEVISYNIPAFKIVKPFIFFAGYAQHVGIYPVPNEDDQLNKEIERYQKGKGTLQFLHNEPLPIGLIKKVAKALVKRIG